MNREQRQIRLQTLLIEILQNAPTLLTSEAMTLAQLMADQDECEDIKPLSIAI